MRDVLFFPRAGVKGMIVLLPLLGLTWVFGIMAINKDTIAFQYLFAILNSLQVRKLYFVHVILLSFCLPLRCLMVTNVKANRKLSYSQ